MLGGRTAQGAEEERPETLQTKDSSNDGRQQCEQGGRYHFLTSNFRDSRAYLSDRRASRMVL
jgi:hypothetical protein